MIFVDSGAWYASAVPDDENHEAARQWLAGNVEPLLTTDYVIDEVMTLFKVRGHAAVGVVMGEALFAGELAEIVMVTKQDMREAWRVFRTFGDKAWSFTDCKSKVVMERLGVRSAFAFDQHFRQFGSAIVVP